MKKDPRVDAYIAKSGDFAKPILIRIRKLVHAAGPKVEETIKWSMPFFMYRGMLCYMASFKAHCALGFWRSRRVMSEGKGEFKDTAMGQFGRLATAADLPSDPALIALIKKAMRYKDEDAEAAGDSPKPAGKSAKRPVKKSAKKSAKKTPKKSATRKPIRK